MNVLKKVNEGGKVTSGDLEKATNLLLEDDSADGGIETDRISTPTWAKNQTELASILGVTRKSIQRWRKEPGFPAARSNGNWNVQEVKTWCQEKDKKTDDEDGNAKYDLEVRRLEAICESLELKLEIERGNHIHIEEVWQQTAQLVGAIKTKLLQIPSALAPALVAIDDVHEMQARLKETVDDTLRTLAEDEWVIDAITHEPEELENETD